LNAFSLRLIHTQRDKAVAVFMYQLATTICGVFI